jgi:hypothetical protein
LSRVFTDLAAWPSSLNLALQFDEGLISIIKTLRQQPCNVEEHDRVLHEQARVSDMKLRGFHGMHVRRVRLIQQRRKFAEHGARLCHLGDLNGLFDDCDRALLQNQQPASLRTSGKHGLTDLVRCKRKGCETLLEDGAIGNQGHSMFLVSTSDFTSFPG